MPTIDQWGPATWIFFHTIAGKLKPNSFPIIGKQVLQLIIEISGNLPCPECAGHARAFFLKMNQRTIQTNQHLKNMLYTFHNIVNARLKKPIFNYERLDKTYEKYHLIHVYNNFVKNYHTKGNMQMLADSFQRQRILASLQQWFRRNLQHFQILPIIPKPIIKASPESANKSVEPINTTDECTNTSEESINKTDKRVNKKVEFNNTVEHEPNIKFIVEDI
jgi:hypothetical protein